MHESDKMLVKWILKQTMKYRRYGPSSMARGIPGGVPLEVEAAPNIMMPSTEYAASHGSAGTGCDVDCTPHAFSHLTSVPDVRKPRTILHPKYTSGYSGHCLEVKGTIG